MRKIESNAPDVKYYNDYITGQLDRNGDVTFFSAIWLLAECYMYRRIKEAFELTYVYHLLCGLVYLEKFDSRK